MRIGASVKWAIESILKRTTFPQQAYGTCNGLLALGKKYGYNRLVRACAIMQQNTGTVTYRAVDNILKNNRDLPDNPSETVSRTPFNDNVRGADAFRSIIESDQKQEDDSHGE